MLSANFDISSMPETVDRTSGGTFLLSFTYWLNVSSKVLDMASICV